MKDRLHFGGDCMLVILQHLAYVWTDCVKCMGLRAKHAGKWYRPLAVAPMVMPHASVFFAWLPCCLLHTDSVLSHCCLSFAGTQPFLFTSAALS